MRKIGAALAAAFLAVLAFTGCTPATTYGDVVEKKYSKPYDYMWYHCYTYKANGTCSFGVWERKYVDADYDVRVRNDSGTEAWLDVTAEEYKSLEVGEFYDAES